jgi:hypothetical protein
MSLEYQTLAADLYWIRTLQYFGSAKRMLNRNRPDSVPADRQYAALYPLLDVTTSLDPRFNLAYRFGATFLSEAPPGGPGRPDLAIALLEKGLRTRPDRWEYMQDIGFVHYWWRHDYPTAAQWFQRAGEIPGAPWWLKSLAAATLERGGDRRSSRAMWEALRESAEVDYQRHDAERHILQFAALDQIDQLQALVGDAAARQGQPVTDWTPLIRAGRIPGVPVDPGGTPYRIDETGRVRLGASSPLGPIPEEPQAVQPARPPA